MRHQNEKEGLDEDQEDIPGISDDGGEKTFHAENIITIMMLEKMIDDLNRDLGESVPTIAAVLLRPKLLRAMKLAQRLERKDGDLDDEEEINMIQELSTLKLSILDEYMDWKKNALDELKQAIKGDRTETGGTLVVPRDWDALGKSLQ